MFLTFLEKKEHVWKQNHSPYMLTLATKLFSDFCLYQMKDILHEEWNAKL